MLTNFVPPLGHEASYLYPCVRALGRKPRECYCLGSWLSILWIYWVESTPGLYTHYVHSFSLDCCMLVIHTHHLQYTDLYVGNPRMVAYIFGSDANTLPGAVCGSWTEWNIITNPNPGE